MLVSTNVTREGERMRGFVVARHAHPAEIELSYDVKEPKAAEGEVVVDVHSAGLNFADILQAQGQYQVQPPLPFVLGAEFSGRISPSSPLPVNCSFRPGDRVFGFSQGAFADKVNVDVRRLYKLTDELNFEEGVGLYVTWFTAYMAVNSDEWVLVTASAGALGLACVQLAKAVGAKVIAAASLPYRLEIARRYGGADYTVNYSDPEWITEVRRIAGGKGVDVAVDVVGNARDLLGCAAWKSRILVVGFAAGSIPKDHNEEERYLGWRLCQHMLTHLALMLHGTTCYRNAYGPNRHDSVAQTQICRMFSSGKVRPTTYLGAYTLHETGTALQVIERRETWGKVVINVRNGRGIMQEPLLKAKL